MTRRCITFCDTRGTCPWLRSHTPSDRTSDPSHRLFSPADPGQRPAAEVPCRGQAERTVGVGPDLRSCGQPSREDACPVSVRPDPPTASVHPETAFGRRKCRNLALSSSVGHSSLAVCSVLPARPWRTEGVPDNPGRATSERRRPGRRKPCSEGAAFRQRGRGSRRRSREVDPPVVDPVIGGAALPWFSTGATAGPGRSRATAVLSETTSRLHGARAAAGVECCRRGGRRLCRSAEASPVPSGPPMGVARERRWRLGVDRSRDDQTVLLSSTCKSRRRDRDVPEGIGRSSGVRHGR